MAALHLQMFTLDRKKKTEQEYCVREDFTVSGV